MVVENLHLPVHITEIVNSNFRTLCDVLDRTLCNKMCDLWQVGCFLINTTDHQEETVFFLHMLKVNHKVIWYSVFSLCLNRYNSYVKLISIIRRNWSVMDVRKSLKKKKM